MAHTEYIRAFSIAGSDSGGGAGIQADIKTMSALGVYAAAAITAVTVQNTVGVDAVHIVPPSVIAAQVRCVMDDIRPSVVKIGMLADMASMKAVHDVLEGYKDVRIILDPVMVATSGDTLMQECALEYMRQHMLPLATIVTPNIPEAEKLAGMCITGSSMDNAAEKICSIGTEWVLIKGGHREGDTMEDRLYHRGKPAGIFSSDTIPTRNTHGTGCTLSSAIAAYIALGHRMEEAVGMAKEYMQKAISAGADISTGKGHGPVNHFHSPRQLAVTDGRKALYNI